MTAHSTRQGPAHPTEEAAALSQTFVLLDNNSGSGPPSLLFSEPMDIIAAWTPEEVPEALKRIEAGVAGGLHAAGFFAYELGYVLEPRLAALMPDKRTVPLLWIGLYKAPVEMTSGEVEHWLATHTRSGSFHFTDVKLAWDEAQYLDRFDEVIEKIRAGDIYQLNLTFKARFRLAGSPLVAALRQAYGPRVQFLLLVRDDFWLAASRLFGLLEVPLIEGDNLQLVDLFEPHHARRVLQLFGQAHGCLPASPAEITAEQHAFLEQAVADLAEDGKVISVRLSLFAEMMKGRPWTVASLPCIEMFAPIRTSSEACMKRFSKIVSLISESPSACVIRAMYWACMSVGKSGCGSVVTWVALRPFEERRTARVL